MGQAKRRGTFEQRRGGAQQRGVMYETPLEHTPQYEQILASYRETAKVGFPKVMQTLAYQAMQEQLVAANQAGDSSLSSKIYDDIHVPLSRVWRHDEVTSPGMRLVGTHPASKVMAKAERIGIEIRLTQPGALRSLHGCMVFARGRAVVFLDHKNEDWTNLLDTMFHELVHATGPVCGRWAWHEQPQMLGGQADHRYIEEELVAYYGAFCLMVKSGRLAVDCRATLPQIAQEAVLNFGGDLQDFDLNQCAEQVEKAMAILL